MAESDAPKNSMILAMVIGTVATLVVVILIIIQYFDMQVRDEVQEKVLSQPSSMLRDLRAMEQDKLSRYAWVDQKAGVVRVPVERAAELTLRDWAKRPEGLVKVEELAPPPATPAPAAPAPAGAAPAAPAPAAPAPTPAAAPPHATTPPPPAPGAAPAPGNPPPAGAKPEQPPAK